MALDTQKDNETNTEVVPSQVITPTMLDNNETQNKKVDISAIIPQGEVSNSGNKIELSSKEKDLKSDGAVIIADLVDDSFKTRDNVSLPNQIDIKARKELLKKNKDKKKKIVNLDEEKINKKKKQQSIMSIVSLIVIACLVIFFFYYKSVPKDSDFKALTIEIELGESLPLRKSEYIKPGIGNTVDEMAYQIDTSNVTVDQVGEYQYTVYHNNIQKKGLIIVKDTTAPVLEVREVVINVGESYDATRFVSNCVDLSGCSYSFEDQETENKYTEAGSYVVYIRATDAYDNKTIKQASLIIEEVGMARTYVKEYAYDFELGYEKIEKYELHFTNFMNNAIILNGLHTEVYIYQDKDKFDAIYKEHNGDVNYTFDVTNKTMTVVEKANNVGYNYSRLSDVSNYLLGQGFKEQ